MSISTLNKGDDYYYYDDDDDDNNNNNNNNNILAFWVRPVTPRNIISFFRDVSEERTASIDRVTEFD